MRFVHLHVHSHYSLLTGLAKIDELVLRAKELGMDALALTDAGNLYGAIEFYETAQKHNIKPIIGMEAYCAPESRLLKRTKIDTKINPIVLLAKDEKGYDNLKKLSTIGFLEGFYYKPRIDLECLAQHAEGLLLLTGDITGAIPQAVIQHDPARAAQILAQYQSIMGKENVYLELSHHPNKEYQNVVNRELIALSAANHAPVVAAQNIYYLKPDDAEAQDILQCVQQGRTIDDQRRVSLVNDDYSLRSPQEMEEFFRDCPEAIANTAAIADRCNLNLNLNTWHFPHYDLPQGTTADEHLAQLARDGLAQRLPSPTEEIRARLDYELEVIKTKGYAAYFLVVADFVNWARDNGIIATTRGSAAGSLVSYAIGVTTVNPLYFRLPFERFLNPYRPSPPDIDMDFADKDRDRVIAYVTEKYGKDKVAQICTFGTMMARGSVRDVGRALGYPYSFCDHIAKLIPFGSQGFQMTIAQALKQVPELRQAHDSDERTRRLLNLAQRIEGCARHCSIHAAGVVISPTPLTDFTPLQREAGGGEKIITQYDMHAVEVTGLVKMDFLGIRNLSILGKAVELIKALKGASINLYKLPLEDAKTFALLSKGQTVGLFQLSGTGMTRYLKELQPTSIHDIMAMVALFRPGPMESIPAYIRRKHGQEPIEYLDPRLKEILERSFGILVYQDDVLLIAIKIAGYNWEEADKLRKAMGKKIPAEMVKQKTKFIMGCEKNGFALERAEQLWRTIEPFAAYGFNKAHAASYGIVAYQTAYLKANYPTEFMCAVLTEESHDLEKIAEAVRECRAMGITVLPPDVNESREEFTIINDATIRFGLAAIKNIGIDVVAALREERTKNGLYGSLEDFLRRVPPRVLNKKSLESMVRAGALDSFGDRLTLNAHIETLLRYGREQYQAKSTGQNSLFANAAKETIALAPPQEPVNRPLTLAEWELELLGLELSAHPIDGFRAALEPFITPLNSASAAHAEQRIVAAGTIKKHKIVTTKNNELMLFAQLEDREGSIELVLFPKTYARFTPVLAENALVVIEGRLSIRNDCPSIAPDRLAALDETTVASICAALQNKEPLPCFDDARASPAADLTTQTPCVTFIVPRADQAAMQTLKETCKKFPGDHHVIIVCNNGSSRPAAIATRLTVAYNKDSTEEFSQLLGAENVKWNG